VVSAGPEAELHAVTASARLRRKIELVIRPLAAACSALANHPRIRELWPEYLITQHAILRATVPLTETAAERARVMTDADPVAAGLANYLDEHVWEELHHDDSLLDDLEVLGIERATVLERMPSPAVASLVGCQYYWALHHHPIAVLGFIGVMEGYPPTPELIETLVARTGYPPEAFRTFAEHGQLDPGHRDRLDRTLDSLSLTPRHESIVGISAITTAGLAARPLEELLERV
jgi:Iron-containing redox enzyme